MKEINGTGLLSQDWGQEAVIGSKKEGNEFKGWFDEFVIATKALSKSEISDLVKACAYGMSSLIIHCSLDHLLYVMCSSC